LNQLTNSDLAAISLNLNKFLQNNSKKTSIKIKEMKQAKRLL
jgi:hypothetical protein